MNLEQKIEAILFFKSEPISFKKLEGILKVSKDKITAAVSNLKTNLLNRGIVILEKNDEIMLGTAPELNKLIENLQKEELNKELSKASLEVLSIVLYKNGVSRAEIDYIRGVNSSFTLRALSIRGLVEKTIDIKDNRRYIYKPSFELMSYMGIKSMEELPDYQEINNSIQIAAENLEKENKEAEEVNN
ncbi:MAG: SMC-Scp complex subunit ScpB [Patescibacteria group bacterium]